MPMVSPLTVAVLAVFLVLAMLAAWIWRARKVRMQDWNPPFELEKLANCISCGSLIPEGVRRCAFCGSWQTPQQSGE